MISNPVVHGNLAVYFIEAPPAGGSLDDFLTLEEGLASGAVRVTEQASATVRELLIENTSDRPCFIQAGDIVRGGQQDRTIGVDFVAPAKSGKVPIPAFCVEAGRWQSGRSKFSGMTGSLPSKNLRIAVQLARDQGTVWSEVAKSKQEFVTAFALPRSESSSLNEELGRKEVRDRLESTRAALAKELNLHPDAVGMAWAINGKMNTVDVYANSRLFLKLAPQRLEAAAFEAASVRPIRRRAPPSGVVTSTLTRGREGAPRMERLGPELESVVNESPSVVRFTCRYRGVELHEQTIRK
jgi:hypothetical protein